MSLRTFSWIAKQPYNIRYQADNVLNDNSGESEQFIQENPKIKTNDDSVFQRGVLWPSLVLVEKNWEGDGKQVEIFVRIFKKKLKLIIDIYMGDDMNIITSLAEKYAIPIYRIITSKKGKRGSVQRLLDFQE